MKNTLRAISYTVFHFMLLLVFADSVQSERNIAIITAFISLIIFILVRPKFDEWKKSCVRRSFFYFIGAVFFIALGIYGKIEAIDEWEDINNFILYFKLCGSLLFIKWIISCLLKNKYKYEDKLIKDYKESFISKIN